MEVSTDRVMILRLVTRLQLGSYTLGKATDKKIVHGTIMEVNARYIQGRQTHIVYDVIAYEPVKLKNGRFVYRKHHVEAEGLAASEVFAKGYETLDQGTLHNKSVLDTVMKKLDSQ